jgi:hypothetical protein
MGYLHDPKVIDIEGKRYRIRDYEKQVEKKNAETLHHVFFLNIEGVERGTAYGFRGERTMNRWLKDHGLWNWWKSRRTPRPSERDGDTAAIARDVSGELTRLTDRFVAESKRLGIDPAVDLRKFTAAVENYDRRRGPLLGSALVFEHCGFTGRRLYVFNGVQLCDLRTIGFGWDNIISSVIVSTGILTLWRNRFTPSSCIPPPGVSGFSLGTTFGPRVSIRCLTSVGENDTTSSLEMSIFPL